MAAMAAERRDEEDLRRLREAHDALLSAKTLEDKVSTDMVFHRHLAEASGNPLFVLVLDVLAELLRSSRRRTIGHGGIGPARRGHGEVLNAVERRDAREARAAMLRHLKAAKRDLDRVKKKGR